MACSCYEASIVVPQNRISATKFRCLGHSPVSIRFHLAKSRCLSRPRRGRLRLLGFFLRGPLPRRLLVSLASFSPESRSAASLGARVLACLLDPVVLVDRWVSLSVPESDPRRRSCVFLRRNARILHVLTAQVFLVLRLAGVLGCCSTVCCEALDSR